MKTSLQIMKAKDLINSIDEVKDMAGLDSWKESRIKMYKGRLSSFDKNIVIKAQAEVDKRRKEIQEMSLDRTVNKSTKSTSDEVNGTLYWF